MPILAYRDFWDVPRAFLVEHAGKLVLFDCPFSDAVDEYPDHYDVWTDASDAIPHDWTWTDIHRSFGRRVGSVKTSDVQFDPTRRAWIHGDVLGTLGL